MTDTACKHCEGTGKAPGDFDHSNLVIKLGSTVYTLKQVSPSVRDAWAIEQDSVLVQVTCTAERPVPPWTVSFQDGRYTFVGHGGTLTAAVKAAVDDTARVRQLLQNVFGYTVEAVNED